MATPDEDQAAYQINRGRPGRAALKLPRFSRKVFHRKRRSRAGTPTAPTQRRTDKPRPSRSRRRAA